MREAYGSDSLPTEADSPIVGLDGAMGEPMACLFLHGAPLPLHPHPALSRN